LIAALASADLPAAARGRIEALFAAEVPSDAEIHDVVTIVADAGGLEYARRRGEQYAEEAEDALDGLPDTVAKGALIEAIAYVMERRW
jgi:geranylgeranyl pyrophosphate synthase